MYATTPSALSAVETLSVGVGLHGAHADISMSEWPGVKKGGKSERLTEKEGGGGEEGRRPGKRGVRRMSSSPTHGSHSKSILLIGRNHWTESAANCFVLIVQTQPKLQLCEFDEGPEESSVMHPSS